MAAEVQNGTGVVQGVANDGTAIAITGYATFLLQKATLDHIFDLQNVQDAGGFDATLLAINEHMELTIDLVLSGATRAAAAATGVFVAPLAVTTLTHFKISLFNSTKWVYIGGTKIDLSNGDRARLTGFKLRAYSDATQATSLSTIVTG